MAVSAGWYPDPAIPSLLRWWDGSTWTAHTQPMAQQDGPTTAIPSGEARPVTPVVVQRDTAKPRKVGIFGARGTAERALTENDHLRSELERLGVLDIATLAGERNRLNAELDDLRASATREAREIQAHLAALRSRVVETEEAAILQEVGLYDFAHILDDSVAYKAAIQTLRADIKALAKKPQGAIHGSTTWQVNGSAKEGKKMITDFSKLMLLAYNSEADTIVASLKPYKLVGAKDRLTKVASTIERLGKTMSISVTPQYHRLRIRELELVADYQEMLAQEKERSRQAREQMREEARVQAEIDREMAQLRKQETLKMEALARARQSGDLDAVAHLEAEVTEAQRAIGEMDMRAKNTRLGYVYVISNVGAFGDGVVKIGMTRRLDPMDRVNELGDASVPFRFDVHALIYSQDAVALETAIHQRFATERVNKVNLRREFFRVSPAQVREALVDLNASVVEYKDEATADEYRRSAGHAFSAAIALP